MAQYLPPSENVPIFDTLNFQQGNIPLTYNTASQYFLTYPTAQGTENLQAINVAGTSTFNNTLTITNGVTSNTLSNTDWTGTIKTALSTQNLTHYLNMSDSSATGQGNPQKSALIMANPSTGIITASGFNGPLTGLASQATTILCTTDNTNGTYYIPFIKVNPSTGTQVQLYTDDITTPLTYNPSISTLNCSYTIISSSSNTATFSGSTLTLPSVNSNTSISNVTISAVSTISTISCGIQLTNNCSQTCYISNTSGGNITISTVMSIGGSLTGTVKKLYSSNVLIASGQYGVINITRNSNFTIYLIDAYSLA